MLLIQIDLIALQLHLPTSPNWAYCLSNRDQSHGDNADTISLVAMLLPMTQLLLLHHRKLKILASIAGDIGLDNNGNYVYGHKLR